jgi:hypothetical protein
VKIDFLITGECSVSVDRLVEMKVAWGVTAPHRLQDLADVLRLIVAADLPRDFGRRLDPYVPDKLDDLGLVSGHAEDDY